MRCRGGLGGLWSPTLETHPRHDLSGTAIGLPKNRPGVGAKRVCLFLGSPAVRQVAFGHGSHKTGKVFRSFTLALRGSRPPTHPNPTRHRCRRITRVNPCGQTPEPERNAAAGFVWPPTGSGSRIDDGSRSWAWRRDPNGIHVPAYHRTLYNILL